MSDAVGGIVFGIGDTGSQTSEFGSNIEQISKSIDPDQTIMSIMAGVTTDALERGLGGTPSD